MLSEGMQISVQSTSLRGKGTNTATPIIANWKWTIPPAGAELQSLSRDDLFALRYLSSGATCKETCPSELPQWFLDQPFERSTRVSDIFMDPRIVAALQKTSNVPVIREDPDGDCAGFFLVEAHKALEKRA